MALASDKQSVLGLRLGFQVLGLGLGLSVLGLGLGLGLSVLGLVLDIALNIQIFWQPTQHRLAFSQVSRST